MATDEPRETFALLIGVDDYSAYARSLGSDAVPEGAFDLRGATNDAALWAELLVRFGVPRDHVMVLASPAPSLPRGVGSGPADCATIMENLERFVKRLDAAGDNVHGLLLFAGHGDVEDRKLLLCPTDTVADGDRLANTIAFSRIEEALERRRGIGLSVVIDACHSGAAADPRYRARVLRRTRAERPPRRTRLSVPAIAACHPREDSYEIDLLGRVHGAFSFAAATVLARWGLAQDGVFSISHRDLQRRTADMLGALAFRQQPAYVGPRREARDAFLQLRSDDRVATSLPDDRPREIHPDVIDVDFGVVLGPMGRAPLGTWLVTPADEPADSGFAAGSGHWMYPATGRAPFELDAFTLAVALDGRARLQDAAPVVFSHPSTPFVEGLPDPLPRDARWFEWWRVGVDWVLLGYLAAEQVGAGWTTWWLSDQQFPGGLVELGPDERFVLRATAEPPLAGSWYHAYDPVEGGS